MIEEVYIWADGNVMAFDKSGQQVVECQGFVFEVGPKLLECCDKDTKFFMARRPDFLMKMDLEWWFDKYK